MSIIAVNIQRLGYALFGGLAYYTWESACKRRPCAPGRPPLSLSPPSPLNHPYFPPLFPPAHLTDVRASQSLQTFRREREDEKAALGPDVPLDRWMTEKNRLAPPAQPLLAIDNFNLENLEGTPAPPNSTSQDRRFSAR